MISRRGAVVVDSKISRAIHLVDEELDFPLLYERLQIQRAEILGNI